MVSARTKCSSRAILPASGSEPGFPVSIAFSPFGVECISIPARPAPAKAAELRSRNPRRVIHPSERFVIMDATFLRMSKHSTPNRLVLFGCRRGEGPSFGRAVGRPRLHSAPGQSLRLAACPSRWLLTVAYPQEIGPPRRRHSTQQAAGDEVSLLCPWLGSSRFILPPRFAFHPS